MYNNQVFLKSYQSERPLNMTIEILQPAQDRSFFGGGLTQFQPNLQYIDIWK